MEESLKLLFAIVILFLGAILCSVGYVGFMCFSHLLARLQQHVCKIIDQRFKQNKAADISNKGDI